MKTIVASFDKDANCNVYYLDGILQSLPESADRQLRNDKKTPYGVAIVSVDYGDGGEPEDLTAIVWGTSLDKGVFDGLEGKRVRVRVNHDGDFPGLCTLQLGGGRVNTNRLQVVVKSAEAVEATT